LPIRNVGAPKMPRAIASSLRHRLQHAANDFVAGRVGVVVKIREIYAADEFADERRRGFQRQRNARRQQARSRKLARLAKRHAVLRALPLHVLPHSSGTPAPRAAASIRCAVTCEYVLANSNQNSTGGEVM
jgi:hypothetical protein